VRHGASSPRADLVDTLLVAMTIESDQRTSAVVLAFVAGTLEIRGFAGDGDPRLPSPLSTCSKWDPRTGCLRAPALAYADVVRALLGAKIPYEDAARRYGELAEGTRIHRQPRPYQSEALKAWQKARGRGVVVLPTGAGKSHVAILAIDDKRRHTLVVLRGSRQGDT